MGLFGNFFESKEVKMERMRLEAERIRLEAERIRLEEEREAERIRLEEELKKQQQEKLAKKDYWAWVVISIICAFIFVIIILGVTYHSFYEAQIDTYLQEGKYDEAIEQFDKMYNSGFKQQTGLKILNKLADEGLFHLAKKVALKIDYHPITRKPLTLALEKTVNNLISEKKYSEIKLLMEEGQSLIPDDLDPFVFIKLKGKVETIQNPPIKSTNETKKSCTSVDDCIAQYDFGSARGRLGNYFSQSAKTKDLIKIIKAESSYWIGKKQYDKAEEVANEIAGIDPTFFDDSFFGDTENATKSAVDFANNSIDDIKISIIESLVKDDKLEEAKKRIKLIKNDDKRIKIQSQIQ